ncbi:unnamed protein product [Mytilus coruscus]|uniref:Endonuclease/exonuclease/phosphatase domain-containing protein n=1 Tax=Mytilus coruscus TaxID=42192 RepID=A0A6J8CLJ9_MYTCO|nr:unnamed protein product [Mytilus coruscus]
MKSELINIFKAMKSSTSEVNKIDKKLTSSVSDLRNECGKLKESILDIQMKSTSNNLIFYNTPEAETEVCSEVIQRFCADTMKIENPERIHVIDAHRLGKQSLKIRPAKFQCYHHREVRLPREQTQSLECLSWNVNGLESCYDDNEFLDTVCKYDILFLCESWLKDNNLIEIDSDSLLTLVNNLSSADDVNDAVREISCVLYDNAFKVFGKTILVNNSTNVKRHNNEWFNANCALERRKFNSSRNLYQRHSTDAKRQLYILARNSYNKAKRVARASFKRAKGLALCKIAKTNPRKFWSAVKPRKKSKCLADSDLLLRHFEQLLGGDPSDICEESESDVIVICGDFDSRIGTQNDFSDFDSIQSRTAFDKTVNQHGKSFLEFFNESKTCVLNGRYDSNKDNFTCIAGRGKSVVDYMCVPHDVLELCSSFQVITTRSVIEQNNLFQFLGDKSKIPDHSILLAEFKTLTNIIISKLDKFKRFRLKSIPNDFFGSDLRKAALQTLIQRIETTRETQSHVDNIYSDLCTLIIDEMNCKIPVCDASRKTRKRHKSS